VKYVGAKNFRPAVDPLPEGAGRPKFNETEIVTTFTYKPSLVRIDARNFDLSWYGGNRLTHTHTHTHTHKDTGPITIHCVAAIARSVITAQWHARLNDENPTKNNTILVFIVVLILARG